MIGVLVLAELGARYGLGLGDPPVSVADAEIDYLFAPNQDCRRFGNRIVYNNLSMRCDFDVDETCKTSRVYVVGDSVVNGGIFSDHEELATTLLQRELPDVQVCNISAGSWGPGNYAAYFRRHRGLRGGMLIVEVNSHDLWEDDPRASGGRLVGKDVAFPDRKPCCALWDACCFIPKICRLMGFNIAAVNTKVDVPKWGEDADDSTAKWNLKELDWLFGEPFDKKVLIIHRSRKETQEANKISVGEARFRDWAKEKGVLCWTLELDADKDYRDSIHMNKNGQWKLYQLLQRLCGGETVEVESERPRTVAASATGAGKRRDRVWLGRPLPTSSAEGIAVHAAMVSRFAYGCYRASRGGRDGTGLRCYHACRGGRDGTGSRCYRACRGGRDGTGSRR